MADIDYVAVEDGPIQVTTSQRETPLLSPVQTPSSPLLKEKERSPTTTMETLPSDPDKKKKEKKNLRRASMASMAETHNLHTEDYLAYYQAASLVDDARYDRTQPHGMTYNELWWYRVCYYNRVTYIFAVFVTLNMCIALIEPPGPLFGTPTWVSVTLEMITLAAFSIRMVMYALCDQAHPWRLLSDKKHLAAAVLIALTFLDIIVHLASGLPRVTTILRPIFVIQHSKDIRHALRDIRHTMVDILAVTFLLIIFVAFYAVICLVLFPTDPNFNSYFNSFISLYVLSTTSNFPDVMMDVYSKSPITALVFVFFLICATFGLTSFLLAVIYNKYRFYVKKNEIRARKRRRTQLHEAFNKITNGKENSNRLSREQWVIFFKILRPHYSTQKALLLWKVIAGTASDIGQEAFSERLLDILNLIIKGRVEYPDRWHIFRGTRFGEWCQTISETFLFNVAVDLLILANNVLIAIAISTRIDGRDGFETGQFFVPQVVFAFIFLIEVFIRIAGVGPRKHFETYFNRFDIFLLLAVVIELIIEATLVNLPHALVYLLLCRTLRLWSTLNRVKRFRVILQTLWQLLPALVTYSIVQLLLLYVYAILGMYLYAGLITEDNPKLQGTTFAENNYFANNFNSFYAAMITLFELMVVNNWEVITLGYVAVTSEWTWVYSLTYNILATVIVLNIIVAFILEAFVFQWALNENDERDELEALIERIGLEPEFCLKKVKGGSDGGGENDTDENDEEDDEGITRWYAEPKQNVRYFLAKILLNDIEAEEARLEMFKISNL